jgi:hypothetical protein
MQTGMTLQQRQSRDRMLEYIQGILIQRMTKKQAYLTYIDPDAKNPNQSIVAMENKAEFKAMHKVISGDANLQINARMIQVRDKFVRVVEKNLDTIDQLFDDVKNGETKEKATVVRLANETISAMAVVAGAGGGGNDPHAPKVDTGGVIS